MRPPIAVPKPARVLSKIITGISAANYTTRFSLLKAFAAALHLIWFANEKKQAQRTRNARKQK